MQNSVANVQQTVTIFYPDTRASFKIFSCNITPFPATGLNENPDVVVSI